MREFILLILGGALIVVVWKLFRKGKSGGTVPGAPAPPDLADLSIRDVTVGDTVSLHGASAEFDDIDFTVDRRNRYESGGESWFEVSGLYRGRRLFLEVYEDDLLEVSFCWADASHTIGELGLTEDELIRLDEQSSRSNTIEALGTTWRFEESGEVGYFKDDRGEGEGFYSWSFRSPDERRVLFIEKYEGDPFEAGVSQVMNPDDIRVFRAR